MSTPGGPLGRPLIRQRVPFNVTLAWRLRTCLQRSRPPCALIARFNRSFIGSDPRAHPRNLSPKMGFPLLDCSRLASSWMTSQCGKFAVISMRRTDTNDFAHFASSLVAPKLTQWLSAPSDDGILTGEGITG